MIQVVAVALLGALASKVVDFLKFLSAKDWNAAVTQLTVWVAGYATVLLFAASAFGKGMTFSNGDSSISLADMNGFTVLIIGLSAASIFSVANDIRASIDSTDSSKKPPLIPSK